MIRRLTLNQVSKLLQASFDDVIAAAIDGDFKMQIPLRDGTFREASVSEIKKARAIGFFEIGKHQMKPAPKGASHFDRLKSAPDRAIWPEQISLGLAVCLENEIRPFIPQQIAEQKKPQRQIMRMPRTAQTAQTEQRDAKIIRAAEDALDSKFGPNFYKGKAGVNKSRIGDHILKHPELYPNLDFIGLTKNKIRTALSKANLKQPI